MFYKIREVLKRLEIGMLELCVGILMIIGFVGYFGTLPADLDWIDHTISFVVFTYFFYSFNITSVLFGKTVRIANFIIVLSYFSLFFKTIISYTEFNAFKFNIIKFVDYFYLIIGNNITLTNIITFYAGIAGIFFVSIYLTKKIKISNPSFLYAISKGRFKSSLTRFFSIFVILLAFFYIVYNPILEWLEFVLDDPIVLIGLVYFTSLIVKHHDKFREKHVIFKIGDLVWGWYKRFISLFHYKKTIPLAISGILILHALSDLGVFAYSMILSKENFYLEFLNKEHAPFLKLFLNDLNNVPSIAAIPLFIIYLFNALSLVIFLIIPVVVWTQMFLQKEFHFNKVLLFFIYSSASVYILMPGYILSPIYYSSVQGLDISSVSIFESKSILDSFFPDKATAIISVSLISILFGLSIYILSLNPKIRKELYAISIIGGLTFYTIYIYYFMASLLLYFYDNIALTIFTPNFLIGLILIIFLILSILFYLGGTFLFLYEVVMEYHKRKWSEPIDEELVATIRKVKSIERKMIKPRKAQFIGEIIKYGLVGIFSIFIVIAGYMTVNTVRERACKTELAKFEIDLRSIDKSLRYGAKELRNYGVPCDADRIYFFDMNKNVQPDTFNDTPIMRDAILSSSSSNVFVVKEGEVKRSFYIGNIEILYPYYICFVPQFGKMSFYVESEGNSAKITATCDQAECTLVPIEISENDARKIIREAVEFGCANCPKDLDAELNKMQLTKQYIEMFRKFRFCDGVTTIEITIRPKKGKAVKDFRFYEFIPKTCIDDLNEFLADNIEGEIDIKGDPLIMWHFDELSEERKFSYKLSKALSNDCKQVIQGLGIAQFLLSQASALAEPQAEELKIEGLTTIIISGNNEESQINLLQYTNSGKDNKNLEYNVIQSNYDIVDCSIKSSSSVLECERKSDEYGEATITLQVFINNVLVDSANINVIVYKKLERGSQ